MHLSKPECDSVCTFKVNIVARCEMKLKRALLLSMLLVIVSSSLGGVAYGTRPDADVKSAVKEFPPKFLDGNRIDLYEAPYRYPADVPSYVFHGWLQEGWKDLSLYWKLNFNYKTITLTIDGVPVKLRKLQHYYKELVFEGETYYDVKLKFYYAEFPANHFEPGKYVFEIRPTGEKTRTVTIKFS